MKFTGKRPLARALLVGLLLFVALRGEVLAAVTPVVRFLAVLGAAAVMLYPLLQEGRAALTLRRAAGEGASVLFELCFIVLFPALLLLNAVSRFTWVFLLSFGIIGFGSLLSATGLIPGEQRPFEPLALVIFFLLLALEAVRRFISRFTKRKEMTFAEAAISFEQETLLRIEGWALRSA